jgi:hypothetical protein
MATGSEVVGWEDVAHRWESDSGLIKEHRAIFVNEARDLHLN